MKFSENWLREWVDPKVSTEVLAGQLTMAGLEVEAVSSCRPGFSGVVVARVTGMEPHPDANHLKVCQLDAGAEAVQVVCGAGNVRTGGCYALAPAGSELPGGRRIEAADLRGVSSRGMLCSAAELGLYDESDRLLELDPEAVPGQDLAVCLDLDDHVIELSLTPNRGDCLGMLGIAREVAVLNGRQFRRRRQRAVTAGTNDARQIKLRDPAACARYAGRIIRDVDCTRPTPAWLRERLRRAGIRSLNVVVDITNYVMLELGQPMHAFDDARLQGAVDVRFARPGEELALLDGSRHSLDADTLVIADARGAVAMAGIMGGQDSAVSGQTRTLFLESAWFAPTAIMGVARRYGLHTDASHRFERGVDPTLQAEAVERATALILSLCGGRPGPVVDVAESARLPHNASLALRSQEVNRHLGADIPATACWDILRRLGFELRGRGGERLVTAPSHRFDIAIEADLVEEIARIHGYDAIPARLPRTALQIPALEGERAATRRMAAALADRGYYEVVTFSFLDPQRQRLLLGETDTELALLNPISAELSCLRRSLWPGLIQALEYNLKRQQQRVRIFEQGRIYRGADEAPVLGGLIYGYNYEKQWDNKSTLCDFYDMKGDLQAILRLATGPACRVSFTAANHPALHPGQSARILADNQQVGWLGAVHPRHLQALAIANPVYVFELELLQIPLNKPVKYEKLSKYPSVRRDLSIIVPEQVTVDDVLQQVEMAAGDYLHNLELFDLYRGEGIDLGKKSLALGLTFQRSSSTLIDEEVDSLMVLILKSLQEKFGAMLRE